MRSADIEAMCRSLADRQFGVVARWQLPPSPALTKALSYRACTGRLVVVHFGVYAYGHDCLTANGHRMAAVLACGPTAVLSHRSAGVMWELLTTRQRRIDVTVPGTSRMSRPRIHVHRTRDLPAVEITSVDGVPITSVARTICDLAGVLGRRPLERVIEQAHRSSLLDLVAIRHVIDRHPSRRGLRMLRALIDEYSPPPLTRSELEKKFLELVTAAGLPAPLVNHRVAGYEVDAFWPQWRLVVELDSRAFHSDPRAFESDPIRDARLQRAHCRVLRVTWRRVTRQPRALLADIRALAALE